MDWTERIGRRLNPRDLHIFMTVVEQGTMARAAHRLAISRPVVSKTIASLEHTCGVRLLDRSRQGAEPTLYGQALLARGMAVFDELKQGIKDIECLADPRSGELRMACPGNIAGTLLQPIIEQFVQKYPRAVFHVDVVANQATFPGLRERKYDLFVCMLLPQQRVPDDLKADVLFNDRLVIATAKNSKWANRRTIDLADLVNEPWVLPSGNSWNYSCLEEAFRMRGLPAPKVSLWSNYWPLRTRLVGMKQFLTAVPRSAAEWDSLKILPVDLAAAPWPVAIVTIKKRTLSPIVEFFAKFSHEYTRSMRDRKFSRAKHKPARLTNKLTVSSAR
jgi:DNA-binding transcriptional LysR family regulator